MNWPTNTPAQIMPEISRIIQTPEDVLALERLIGNKALPFTVVIRDGKHRTNKQNKLQRMWMTEAAEQLQDQTAEDYRGYCKAHFGLPILINENAKFAEAYERDIRPLPYEMKLRLMKAPFDFGVTRLMTTKQKKAYLDAVYYHLTGLGVKLTGPEGRNEPND